MDSTSLTLEQIEKLKRPIGDQVRWTMRLCQRMVRAGFPRNDELYQTALKMHAAAHEMNMRLHYLSCKGGVGRSPRGTSAELQRGEVGGLKGDGLTDDKPEDFR